MTPKELRDSLFRKSRPNIRPIEIYDGDEYHKDIKILWVAHKLEPIPIIDEGLTQEEFVQRVIEIVKTYDFLVAEDDNKQYKGFGIVGAGIMSNNGWKFEPHTVFFPWATNRNILRCNVAFFQFIRYSRKVGCCLVYSLEKYKNLFDHICKYGVLHYVGKVFNCDPRGDQYLYSVRGKKK